MEEIKIPSAEQVFQDEANHVLREGTYEFQIEKILEEIKNLNKNNDTVNLIFKGLPHEKILKELEEQGYRVKFDTCYDSSKAEKYLTKVRIINPKFSNPNNTFMDNIEDQLKGCVFSKSSSNGEDVKKIFQSLMSQFK